ncbi:unnamed protein product [Tilletia laevis]|uniref:Uncharacterized protein n=4 Tax=Tilletia TaxID=13289 RepID=A0A8X7MMY7_9BASI|nr:hypothetical protein CF336_g6930 [Tilletia laevis]KAE8242602.1 hypothetical protein A4X06_0g6833 [Tilletia controversa]CAD6888949.1 unnamed protein product [Tilletia caries]CAD6903386.1 unnamed protein product [Tilletia controversa]CAD6913682.1 unnamed protein product [Tilletia caries]
MDNTNKDDRLKALKGYESSAYTDDYLGLTYVTTWERLKHINKGLITDVDIVDIENCIKGALAKNTLTNPTELLKVGYPDQRSSFADQTSDKLQNVLDTIQRKSNWPDSKRKKCRQLLELVAYSVLRESGLKQKHGNDLPLYDPRSKSSTDFFLDCYDKATSIDPQGNAVLNHFFLTSAWQALFEDQLELARSDFALWTPSFDVLLLFVGLLSAVIASFVTSFNPDKGAQAAQAAIAGYRIALLLALIAGVIALRERYVLTALSATTIRSKNQNAAGPLPARLMTFKHSVAIAQGRVPSMLFLSTQLLLLAIVVFVAAFLASIVAPSNKTGGDWASFGITLALAFAAIAAASVSWTTEHTNSSPSLLLKTCWSALERGWNTLAKYLPWSKTTPSPDSEQIAMYRQDSPMYRQDSLIQWAAFFDIAARIESQDRSERIGAAVCRTLVAHCPQNSEHANLIAHAIHNLLALGSQSMLRDLLNCAVLVYDRNLSDKQIWSEVDHSSREAARRLKVTGDARLAEQVRVAAKLFRLPANASEGADLRYMLAKMLTSTEPSCSLRPVSDLLGRKRNVVMKLYTMLRNQKEGARHAIFFLAISDVPLDEHVCLSTWGLRRLAWDVHMLRRTDLWRRFQDEPNLFSRFEKPCGHFPTDPDCHLKREKLPFFLQEARRLALGRRHEGNVTSARAATDVRIRVVDAGMVPITAPHTALLPPPTTAMVDDAVAVSTATTAVSPMGLDLYGHGHGNGHGHGTAAMEVDSYWPSYFQ